MKQYYECHITIKGDPCKIFSSIEKAGWKYSAIDGDPDLGKGVKCYATKQFNKRLSIDNIILKLKATADLIKELSGAKILRKKIELVIYDKITR